MAGLEVVGLGHVAIYVSDLARSMAWYREMFGFEDLWYYDHPNTGTRMQFMQTHGVIIELVQRGPGRKQRDGIDGTINHLCIQVADIAAAKAELEAKGCTFVTDIVHDTELYPNGEKNAMLLGPDGEKVQIEEIL